MIGPSADQQPNSGHTPEPVTAEVATPAWMQMSTRPLEAALRGAGQDHIGAAATLWPLGQDSDAAAIAGRYLPDTIRHPQRTRAALTAHVIEQFSRPGRVVFDGVGSGTMVEAAYTRRQSIGVDQDVRRVDVTTRNVAFAHEHGATGNGLVRWADTRDLTPIPRRMRHSVDLATPAPAIEVQPTVRLDGSVGEPLPSAVTAAERTASLPRHGLPMARLASLVREGSAYYAVTTVDHRGRLADRSPLRILRWSPGLPITSVVLPGAVVMAAQRGGREAVTRQGHLRLPADLRHALQLKAGDQLLVAAHPDRGLLVVYTMSALDAMVSTYHAPLAAGTSA